MYVPLEEMERVINLQQGYIDGCCGKVDSCTYCRGAQGIIDAVKDRLSDEWPAVIDEDEC